MCDSYEKLKDALFNLETSMRVVGESINCNVTEIILLCYAQLLVMFHELKKVIMEMKQQYNLHKK